MYARSRFVYIDDEASFEGRVSPAIELTAKAKVQEDRLSLRGFINGTSPDTRATTLETV